MDNSDEKFEKWWAEIYSNPVPDFYKTIARMAWEAGYDAANDEAFDKGYDLALKHVSETNI